MVYDPERGRILRSRGRAFLKMTGADAPASTPERPPRQPSTLTERLSRSALAFHDRAGFGQLNPAIQVGSPLLSKLIEGRGTGLHLRA